MRVVCDQNDVKHKSVFGQVTSDEWILSKFLAFLKIGSHFSVVCQCLVCHQNERLVLSEYHFNSKP